MSVGVEEAPIPESVPKSQTVLLLHSAKDPYHVTKDYLVPSEYNDSEILVKTHTIGLNPIDWKAPDFNFGLPELPYIAGRELVGQVVRVANDHSRLHIGDLQVIVVSSDYRDLRKAAYQEYVIASDFNVAKLPPQISVTNGAAIGVAFVAAALSLGVCLGADFSDVVGGPNLFKLVREHDPELLPKDVRSECLGGISENDRAKEGDWVAVWGGSATSANLIVQLARLVGLQVITVVDKAKHGLRLSNHTALRPDLLVDSYDPERAIEIIRANTKGKLRFGIDTRGRDTATHLLHALMPEPQLVNGHATSASHDDAKQPKVSAHLVGLTGLPKEAPPAGVTFHTVPIKIFHDVPAVGETLVLWLERLLEQGLILPPEVLDVEEGFEGVNRGLDRMRKGEISGGRLVVKI
ncbi:quinone oxidoreductase [Lepidopterella palustris CBS 459.81]|uniref:Quinone oxidoreductase n=1 Tax=Lepidopterella palustris CBS 459.81 TaxID=1314670 RepID=A0A8E2E365_9PEZI|nr:quinone oxidoreductase [Lepidopterella palustris CBS 459.81]